MEQKFYHSKGCNSATIELGGRTVLYFVKPSEVKVHSNSKYLVRNPNYAGKFDKKPEFIFPRTTIPKHVIVAGYVVGEYVRTEKPSTLDDPVTKVEPITDESERKELSDLLKQRELPNQASNKSNISFW